MGNEIEKTYIAYFDESGDDGNKVSSSDLFVLTSFYLPTNKWSDSFNTMRNYRRFFKQKYGFHVKQEMHTKNFLTEKNPYREYSWTADEKREILKHFMMCISRMNGNVINVIIDKANIKRDDYKILENALTYSIQRIENASGGDWNYLLVSDEGRIAPMRRTARAIRLYNPIKSMFDDFSYTNQPIRYMIEDMFEKSSEESYFIQVCDFISYFVNLYYQSSIKNKPLPNRVAKLIDKDFVVKTMDYFKDSGVFNIEANRSNEYGLVVYPKK